MNTTNNQCHTVQTAAILFKVSPKVLFKKLREIGWLHTGTRKNFGLHNMPKTFAVKNGWLTTQEKGYSAPYNNKVTLIYKQTIITQQGFIELQKIMQDQTIITPKIAFLSMENAQKNQQKLPSPAAQEEREKTIQQLREWGLAS